MIVDRQKFRTLIAPSHRRWQIEIFKARPGSRGCWWHPNACGFALHTVGVMWSRVEVLR